MAILRGLGVLAALFVAPWSTAAGASLEPHVAAYRLSLADGRAPSLFTEVRGGLVIEWRLACDGWLSRQRLAFLGTLEEGGEHRRDVRFSSWEALDGSRIRYSYRSYGDDQLLEDFRGEAHLNPPNGGVANFTLPSRGEVELPPDTIFPTVHLQSILDDASEGERFVSHQVFDGAGFDSLTQITSAIGQPQMVEPLADERRGERRAWPVSMAYYEAHTRSDVPQFEAAFLLGDNGVLRELALDYGEFRLNATLEKLELLERPDC
jgi:EipB-like